jgi:hypothetical protein
MLPYGDNEFLLVIKTREGFAKVLLYYLTFSEIWLLYSGLLPIHLLENMENKSSLGIINNFSIHKLTILPNLRYLQCLNFKYKLNILKSNY